MNYKRELIKRYQYLYENIDYILLPYMRQQSIGEFFMYKIKHKSVIQKPLIYLESLDRKMLLSLEEFLFCDILMEQSSLFHKLEEKKQDPKFLEIVKQGLRLLKLKNSRHDSDLFRLKLDLWKLLQFVRWFIEDQVSDLENKELKLEALDEYFRIYRYSNDDRIWTSGYHLTVQDAKNVIHLMGPIKFEEYDRDVTDIGLKNNAFIQFLSDKTNKRKDNCSILSEKEKQEIYLKYHDEMPWDFICDQKKKVKK